MSAVPSPSLEHVVQTRSGLEAEIGGPIGERTFWDMKLRACGVPRDSVGPLLRGERCNLGPEVATHIAIAARGYARPPWESSAESVAIAVRDALGEFNPTLNHTKVNCYVYTALRTWMPLVLVNASEPGARLLEGLLAAQILLTARDSARTALREVIDPSLLQEIDAPATGVKIDHLLDALRNTTASLAADPVTTSDPRRQRGLESIHYRTGVLALHHVSNTDKVGGPEAAIAIVGAVNRALAGGFVENSIRMSTMCRHSCLTYVKNPWLALVFAGQWKRCVEFSPELFGEGRFRENIRSPCQGHRAMLEDRDAWLGFAAMLAYPETWKVELVKPRADLLSKEASDAAFRQAMRTLKPMILAGASFMACRAAIA